MEDDEEAPPLAIEIDQPLGPYSQQQPNSSSHKDDDVLVGVTVITSYLGAGKSTLVNHILNSQHGKKIAVILNDFGEEIGVERAMINKGDGGALVEEWVELAKGGIFCIVKHSLVQALEQLVPKRKFLLDRILLETTGLANLAPLASVLWLDDNLELLELVLLNAYLAALSVDADAHGMLVVDAKNLRYQLSEHRISSSFAEAYLQIAFADVIIINKVDLVSPEGSADFLEELEKEIHSINSLASIIRSHATELASLLEESRALSTSDLHDSGVRTLCISEPRQVDLEKVRLWIEEILWEKKHDMDVYRCKGVLSVHNSNQLLTLQEVSFCSSPHSNRVIQEFAYLHFSGLERIRRKNPLIDRA
ncbi:hypothetical protein C1H46_025156 [Malus baccata]|uniref:CobW/HypB/UreG nucleotide-binding domain-containing protein n=1 Tax=Malus baccata TaxID=106549 RepID=A0A540LS54_MALBA|nr:hypothetical protein C1H46_025156 [Malus baccata]